MPEPQAPADFQAMTPAQWRAFREGLIRQAHHARAEAIRDAVRWLGSGIGRPVVRLGRPVGTWLAHQWQVWRIARARREAVMQLTRFTDSELKDIGLTRGEIYAAVYQRNFLHRGARWMPSASISAMMSAISSSKV